ncbi:MAG: alpha-hydroxy acid oxidase [Rhodospirillaceae bacterium]
MRHTTIDNAGSLQQIAVMARRNLTQNVWDYLMGGSESETTLKRNRLSFDCWGLRPRILRGVAEVDPSAEFLGKYLRLPVMLAPIGSLQELHLGAALATAQAAAEVGTISFMSSVTQPSLEEVSASTSAPKVYQQYIRGDDDWLDGEVKRACNAGFDFFCLTVDTALYSRRERDLIKRWAPASRLTSVDGFRWQSAFTWDNIKRFKDKHDIPLIIKGIGCAEDAGLAVEHGAACVYVSNHGGRQLDHGRGSIEVLPEVSVEVDGRVPILMDGGIMRGTDVIKAIALGATAVCIGKLQGLGLGAGGKDGVVKMLRLLEDEIITTMQLTGLRDLKECDRNFIEPAEPVVAPHQISPYPHINLPELEYKR